MSLFTAFRTGVMGMRAQARGVRSIAGDIANAKTVGYKGRTSEFSSLVNSGGGGGYSIWQE
jgi:flagellar hook protein FlgE